MTTYSKSLNDFKRSSQLPDFDWRSTAQLSPPRNASRAALHISQRFGLSLDHAITIASLAGIAVNGGWS